MHSHILRPGPTGPNTDQERVLRNLDLDPADFKDIPRDHIGAVISAELRRRKDYANIAHQKQASQAQRERELLITTLGLQAGTRVLRKVNTKKGAITPKKDVVVGITPNWYVRFGGPQNPIHPSLIIRVLKEP